MESDVLKPTSAAPYLAIAVIFAVVAVTLAWLQVEGVINPAASQIVRLGIGAALVVVALRVVELLSGGTDERSRREQ